MYWFNLIQLQSNLSANIWSSPTWSSPRPGGRRSLVNTCLIKLNNSFDLLTVTISWHRSFLNVLLFLMLGSHLLQRFFIICHSLIYKYHFLILSGILLLFICCWCSVLYLIAHLVWLFKLLFVVSPVFFT